MTKSTSNSPPQGLNWTVIEQEAGDAHEDDAASKKQDESGDIKGLFDKHKRTSLTPLPVGQNISLPPMPRESAQVKLENIATGSQSAREPEEVYPPPPVAAFGGKKATPAHANAPSEDFTKESARGLFSADGAGSQEKNDIPTEPAAARPVVPPARAKSKKTVVGLGLGQPPMPPIPPAVKEIEKAKEAAVRPTPTPVEEKPPRVSEPTASGPVAPLAMADTLFSGISTIPSVPSKPATTPSITSEQTKQRSIEPRTPRPPAQPSIEAEPSVRSRPRGKRARTVALWMGAGLLLAAVAIAAATTGLFRSASERSIATGEQAPVRPIDGNPLETRDRKRAVPTAIATPQAEKARIDRVQTEPPARPAKPPEPAAIEDQKVEPLEQPKEHKEPESVETAIEPRPEQDGGAREMLARAIRQLKNGDLDQAEALFRAILKQEPDEHHAMEGLVTILIKRGKGKEALPFCERMVKKRPRRAAYRVLFGDALAMAGNSRAAKEQYNEALRYSPDDKDAKRRLAQTK